MGDELVVSPREQWWDLASNDKVSVWAPSRCGIPAKELLLVNEAQLAG